MLRDVLTLLNQAAIWERIPRVAGQNLVIKIVDFACRHHDCNAGEILEGHEAFGICYSCRRPVEQLRQGMCVSCWPDDEEEEFSEEQAG